MMAVRSKSETCAVLLCILLGTTPVLGLLIVASSTGEHQPTFVFDGSARQLSGNLTSLLDEPAFRLALTGSVQTATAAAFGAFALACPLALALKLYAVSSRRWIVLLVAVGTLFSSNYLKAFAFSVALVRLDETGLAGVEPLAYSHAATTFFLALSTAPYCAILCALGFERTSDASRLWATNLGSGVAHYLRRLLLPTAATALLGSFVCALVISLGDPIAPAVVGGGKFPNLPAWSVDQYRISAVPRLATVALVQALLSIALFVFAGVGALRARSE
jgi:ABC-type Fe3+ transport system permease subunit